MRSQLLVKIPDLLVMVMRVSHMLVTDLPAVRHVQQPVAATLSRVSTCLWLVFLRIAYIELHSQQGLLQGVMQWYTFDTAISMWPATSTSWSSLGDIHQAAPHKSHGMDPQVMLNTVPDMKGSRSCKVRGELRDQHSIV